MQIVYTPFSPVFPLPPVGIVSRLGDSLDLTLHIGLERGPIVFEPRIERMLEGLSRWMAAAGICELIIHSDHFPEGEIAALRSRLPGIRLLIENMGAGHAFGSTIPHICGLLESDPELGFVLDIAHLRETDSSEPLNEWIGNALIRERLRYVHVSTSRYLHRLNEQEYASALGKADHLPSFLYKAYPEAPIKNFLAGYPLIAEGCCPPGQAGLSWLKEELKYLESWAISGDGGRQL